MLTKDQIEKIVRETLDEDLFFNLNEEGYEYEDSQTGDEWEARFEQVVTELTSLWFQAQLPQEPESFSGKVFVAPTVIDEEDEL